MVSSTRRVLTLALLWGSLLLGVDANLLPAQVLPEVVSDIRAADQIDPPRRGPMVLVQPTPARAARGESLSAFDERCIPSGLLRSDARIFPIFGRFGSSPAGRIARGPRPGWRALGAAADFRHGLLGPLSFESDIAAAAKEHGVEEQLIRAIIQTESEFDRHAVSGRGACGLMQLMPRTARSLGVKDCFDARQNIHAGTRYLKTLLLKYEGRVSISIAAYHAGEGAVLRHGGIPPYRQTRDYVRRVRALL